MIGCGGAGCRCGVGRYGIPSRRSARINDLGSSHSALLVFSDQLAAGPSNNFHIEDTPAQQLPDIAAKEAFYKHPNFSPPCPLGVVVHV